MSLIASQIENVKKMMAAKRWADARRAVEDILRKVPGHPEGAALAGFIALEEKRYEDAAGHLARAVSLNRSSPELHNSLSIALASADRFEESEAAARKAVELRPAWGMAWMQLGLVLGRLERHPEALATLEKARDLAPTNPKVWFNLGNELVAVSRAGEAVNALRRADELAPNQPIVLAALGSAILEAGSIGDALKVLRRAQSIEPDSPDVLGALGRALVESGEGEEGCPMLERSITLKPGSLARLQVVTMSWNYTTDDWATIRRVHERHSERLAKVRVMSPAINDRNPERTLRVAFMSGDLREHSCSYFLEPLFAGLDRARAQVWAVQTLAKPDEVTARFRGYADGWIDITGKSAADAADMVRAAGIDILIECSGHTTGHRLDVSAARPAPIQMTFLGYPATTGLDRIDYRLVDAITDPPGAERHCVETLLRVPGCLWCFRPSRQAPPVGPSPLERTGQITLGCFNMIPKLSRRTVEVWAEALKAVPTATLLLKNKRLHDAATMAWFRGRFEKLGVDGSRISAVPFAPSTADHLRSYDLIDLQLDPFPYNGTTTTCESFWQGVPAVALRGKIHAAKVSESLLHAVSLEELLADDEAGYVRIIAELASDPARMASIRAGLRDRMAASPLRDEQGYCERFEATLRTAWRRWCMSGA